MAAALAFLPVAVWGQGAGTFTVASVKRNVSGVPYGQSSDRSDGLAMVNERLRDVILFAFDIHDFQLAGAPEWVARDRFDITARAERSLSVPEKRARLRQLLADRFALRARLEVRDQATFALTRANRSGERLVARDCAVPGLANLACGRGLAAADGGMFRMAGIPLARLAAFLSGALGRVVADETGLAGVFDVDLQWRPDIGLNADLTDEAKARIETRPALSAALREQLGLNLEPRRGAVRVVVIDDVRQPAPD